MSSSSEPQPQASGSKNPTDYLRTATFSRGDRAAPPSAESVASAADLLKAASDPAKLHPLADLGDKLDYLLLDDDKTSEIPGADTAIPSRGWSDDLCYGTGTMYLSGMFADLFHLTAFVSFPPHLGLVESLDASLTLSQHLGRPILVLLIVFLLSHVHPGFP